MVEVKTEFNADIVRKYGIDRGTRMIWFPVAVMAALVIFGIVALFADLFGSPWYALLFIALGVVLPVIYWFSMKALVDYSVKRNSLVRNGTRQTWHFLDEKMILNERVGNRNPRAHDTQFTYDDVKKVLEREAGFYMYLYDRSVYILDAKGINGGSRRDLHDFLLNKLGSGKFKYQKSLYEKK